MTPEEIVNLSLSNLIFTYNLHFATFKDQTVKDIHRKNQIIDGTINSSDDFEILTNNNLLSSFQSHAILLHEALKEHSKKTSRNYKLLDDPLYAIRQFVDELRHAHAHIEGLKLIWDGKKGKQSHTCQIQLPVIKTSDTTLYDPNSTTMREFSFKVIPKHEIQLNQTFIMEIIIFSFHIREILKFRDVSTCDQFLKKFKSSWN